MRVEVVFCTVLFDVVILTVRIEVVFCTCTCARRGFLYMCDIEFVFCTVRVEVVFFTVPLRLYFVQVRVAFCTGAR